MGEKRIDEATGVETTGHEFDGIAELNNPMPQWWLTIFYATVAFAAVYVVLFPAIPMITTSTQGLLGYSTRGSLQDKLAAHAEGQSQWRERIAAASLEEIRQDPDLMAFAMASGAANFALNCSQCHGAGAAGNVGGYPNLNDDDWIWGGDLDSIYHTIAHGVRNEEDPDARFSMMPSFGTDGILSRAEIADVTQAVLDLNGRATDAEAAARGREIYLDNCAACHGEGGEGAQEMGAPALANNIWLYGGTAAEISAQIWRPRHGVMPPWIGRLGEEQVKELTIYVHSLGGGV
ncbi:MAG: cytochrome-c oxidase, cbb3-type subunit III [Rubrimonas sp.]